MATINRFLMSRHLRAEANQFILHFRRGRLVRAGAGLAYWFSPLSAAVAQVPAEDCDATFVLHERCADSQLATVQATVDSATVLEDFLTIQEEHTAVFRIIFIRLEHGRCMRTKRTISKNFNPADTQFIVAEPRA